MLIKKKILLHDIKRANEGNKWSFGNSILYDMCRENSEHTCAEVIIGKIWLIGRSYAVAIERRKKFNELEMGDDFYYDVVAPKMLAIGPELDRRINNLKQFDCIRKEHLKEIVDTHLFLTNIFLDITGLNKRSLASKYLHFHVPNMFYIYDSRAIQRSRDYIMPNNELRSWLIPFGDIEYIELVIRLFTFQKHVATHFRLSVTPRAIDSFLLNY